ncbi:hypothetical protein HKX48_003072 [Thoreauomyces humboldtii]|nr:hypothetical protein HKX48_003072 [Thoreauomyces humboldtii]
MSRGSEFFLPVRAQTRGKTEEELRRTGRADWAGLPLQDNPIPNVFAPDLVLKEHSEDYNYYTWNWEYAAPMPTELGSVKSELLPPTGGWKNFCCLGEYDAASKHFRAIMIFEFFVSSVVTPVARQSSQSFVLVEPTSRRTSLLPLEPSPLSMHSEFTDTTLSPRSARSALPSPLQGPPMMMQAAPLHRREHSSASGNSVTNLEEVDDEPAFRHTIETLEKRTVSLKHSLKQANKHMRHYIETGRTFKQAGKELSEAIGDIPNVDAAVVNMLKEVAEAIDRQMDNMLQQVENLVLVQSDAMYADIKETESQKKVFDQEFKEFNNSEQKYLSMRGQKQKLSEADTKWHEKKKNYELKRLDYYCHLKDLHGAHMEGILDINLIVLAEKQVGFYKSVAEKLLKKSDELAILSTKWKEVNEKSNEEKRGRDERRKLIESKAQLYTEGGQNEGAFSDPEDDSIVNTKFKGIRDLVQVHDSDTAAFVKGYLWVAAVSDKAPNGQPKAGAGQLNWKKLWCVLQKGILKEYNLKRNQTEETFTTNLRLCTIRDSRNTDRRFSFEIISGGGGKLGKRLYQATDAEDMKAWMVVVQNSIQGMLSGTQTMSDTFAPEFGLGPHGEISRMGPSSEMVWGVDEPTGPIQALETLREADPGNYACAECSAKNPDWISINLGCIICIDCSGSHRKMGTHITKVRSLTLDQSWTPELIAMLRTLGNTKVNAIWEADLSQNLKPTARDPRDVKEKFINDKYIGRLFVERPPTQDPSINPSTILFRSAAERDIIGMMRAISLGVDVNSQPSDQLPLLLVVLGYPSHPPPVPPRRESSITLSSPPSATSPSFPSTQAHLRAAEFVIQHGVNLNAVNTLPEASARITPPGTAMTPKSNLSALHYAAAYHDLETLSFLVMKGADVLQKDAAGRTPLDLVELNRSKTPLPQLPRLPGADLDQGSACAERLAQAIDKQSR